MNDFSVPMTQKERTFGWCWLAFQLLAMPVLLQILALTFHWGNFTLNILSFFISFLATAGIFHRYLWVQLRRAFRAPFRVLRTAFLCFALYQIASSLLNYGIYALVPDFANANDSNIGQMVRTNYTLMAICTIILAPISEELLFRGLIFGSLFPKSKWISYAVSCLAFSAIHVTGYIGTVSPVFLLIAFLQYLPAGLCLALSYHMSDSVWTPILIHITVNQIAMLSVR